MTKTLTQVAAFALAAVVTTGVFAGANGLAAQQYQQADLRVAALQQPVQHVTIVGHRGQA